MFTLTTNSSNSGRWPLMAAVALGILLAVAPASFGKQDPVDSGTPQTEVPSNADLDAAAGDMELSPSEVQQLQETLRDLGYFSGPADGRRGPRTREALRDFQTDQALPVTGSLDPGTVTRIGHQARVVGVPNQPPVAAIERASGTEAPVGSTDPGAAEPAVGAAAGPTAAAADPASVAAPPPSRKSDNGVKDAVGKTGDVVVGAGSAAVKGVRVGGGAAVDGVVTAGKSTAKAGVVTGKSVATAGTKTVDGTLYVGKSIKNGTVFVATKTRDLFVGDRGTSREDEQIRQSLISQYATDDRLTPSEIEVKVHKGHVTLGAPEGARSDMSQASRLARITPGVKTVTTVFTSVREQPVADPVPAATVPVEAPIVDPEMTLPAPPEEPASPEL